MKKIIYGVLLGLICFIFPVCAETTSNVSPSLTLNHLTYVPKHEAKIIDHMLYLSGEDLAEMTYGELTKNNDTQSLKIQNKLLTYSGESYCVKLDGTTKSLKYSTRTLNETIYLPICVLDLLCYDYTYQKETGALTLVPVLPYSTATDSYQQHTVLPTSYKSAEELLEPLLDATKASSLIYNSKAQNQYISFMTTKYKEKALEAIQNLSVERDWKGYKTNVHLRVLDLKGETPKLSTFKTLSVTYKVSPTDGLSLSVGDKACPNPFFWAVYNPRRPEGTSIDINKSLDTMIMRCLYVYYRDQYGFKDDTDTAPITLIQMGRSDSAQYTVYSSNPSTQYQIVLYKQSSANTADYYVDLIAK